LAMGQDEQIEDGSPASDGLGAMACRIWGMAHDDLAAVHKLLHKGITEFALDPTSSPKDRAWVLKELAKIYGILVDKLRSMARDGLVVLIKPDEGEKNVLRPTTAEAMSVVTEIAKEEKAQKQIVEKALAYDRDVVKEVRAKLKAKARARRAMDKTRAKERAEAAQEDDGNDEQLEELVS